MSSEKIQILAIDDKNDNLISLKAIINDVFPEAEVITAASGKKGITLAGEHDPDVILLDIVMPEMDGYEVCRKLKSDPKLADIPVVFLTALRDDSNTRIKALEAGAEAFLSKPIDVAELTAQVKAMIKVKAANLMKRDEKGYLEFMLNSRTKALEKELAERKKAEGNLRIAHERLLTVLDGINAVVYVADIETHELLFVNQYGQKDFQAFEKQKCWEILQEDQTGPCDFCTNDHLFDAEGNPAGVYRWEFQNTKNGRWYDCQDSAIKWIDGRTVRLEIATDITERKEAEEKVRENERFLESVFESIQDGLSILDTDLNVRQVNKVMKKWYAPNLPLEGKKCYQVYHKRDRACEACPTIKCIKTGKTESAVMPGLPGTDIEWVELFSYPVKDAQTGETTGVVEFVRDVTERVRSEIVSKKSRDLAIHQRTSIAELVIEDCFVNGDMPEALKRITKMLSQLIEVERASVWHLTEDKSELICLDLYEASKQAHSSGDVLKTKIFPSYFEAIESESRIYADDAQNDPRSGELTESYLKPLNISSLLDAGITIGGSLIGVVSCEHIGDSRKWRPDEESFISTIAAIVSQLFENDRRRQAEQKLKESEETYRNIFQNAQVGLFRTRISDGEILESNEQLARMCGYDSREEFINEYFTSHHYVDAGVRNKMLDELNENGDVQNFEARFYRKDRSIFWVSFSARIFPEKGWLEGVVEDITERKHAEETIRESESKYRLLIETMNDGVMQVDNKDRIIFVNQRICDMFGYDAQDLVGQISYKTLIFQDDWNIILEKNDNRTKKITEHYEVRGVKKTDEVFWIQISAAPVADQNGIVVGSVGILRDISEGKKTEINLKESETKFRTLFENANDAIFLMTGDEFIDCNPKTLEIFKCRRDQIIGTKPYDFSPLYQPDGIASKEAAHKKISAAIKGKPQSFEWQHNDLEGNLFDAEVSLNHVVIEGRDMIQAIVRDITYRKKAEEALRENEQRFRMVLENMPILLNAFDHAGNFIAWNKACEEVTGYKASEVIGHPDALRWMYPDQEYRELVWKSSEDPHITQKEFNLITKSGETRIISWFDTFHYVDIPGWASWGIGLDITKRRRAEENLLKTKQLLEQTSKMSKVGGWEKNLLNGEDNWSDVTKEIHEVEPDFVPDMKNAIGFYKEGESRNRIAEVVKKLIETGEPYDVELQLITAKGNERWIRTIGMGDFREGVCNRIYGTLQDITIQKRTENLQQVLYQTAKATITSETIEELLVVVRNELGKVLDTTNFIVALYDPDEEMLRKVIFIDEKDDFTAWKTENTLSGMVVKLGESILLTREKEAEFAKKHGLELQGTPAECWLGVPMISNNQVTGVMVVQSYTNTEEYDNNSAVLLEMIAHEVSIFMERRNMIDDLIIAKNQAEAGNRLKTEFMNNISHEIRTPLNGILGSAQLIAYPDMTEHERNANIENMRESTDRLLNTIADYMDASLLASNNMKANISNTSVNTLFYELYLDFQGLCEAKNIAFHLEIPDQKKDVIILSDKQLLRKAMRHLLNNALKFTNKGVISFGYSLQESNLRLFVKDTGIGIDDDAMEKIFEAFVYEESGLTRKYEGSGLGLTIANGIINLLGGNISVDSEKGKGSAFYFSLPNMLSGDEIKSETPAIMPVEISEKPLILIAEDEDSNYNYVNTVLIKAGFDTIRASNGNEAISACTQNHEINLILMDLKMPKMDGFEATRIIKKHRPAIPVIATTAYALTGDRELALEAGCSDYLAKPFEKADLLNLINQYIHQKPH
jgi:PAS domain S-box-containing protein